MRAGPPSHLCPGQAPRPASALGRPPRPASALGRQPQRARRSSLRSFPFVGSAMSAAWSCFLILFRTRSPHFSQRRHVCCAVSVP